MDVRVEILDDGSITAKVLVEFNTADEDRDLYLSSLASDDGMSEAE